MDQSLRIGIIFGIGIFLGLGLPVLIYLGMRRGTIEEFNALRKTAERAVHPWDTEEKNLKELSRRVAELKRGNDNDTKTSPEGQDPQR